jgi:putative phosphoribosyl transferase
MLLKNRKDAADQLANLLQHYNDKNVLILACSLNAVETAYHLSRKLKGEFSVLISSALSYPGHQEYCFGALCEGDKIYVDDARHLLTDSLIKNIVEKQKRTIIEKAYSFRSGRPLPQIANRIVILLDDALILGLEFIPAIRLCESLKASRIVISAPVGGLSFHQHINDADELRIVHQYTGLTQPDEVYESYSNLEEFEIRKFLRQHSN